MSPSSPSNLPSYSIPTPDLWISCSLFRMENGDWANFPQAFLTINQQRDAHLHTLSWWLSAIFQNSVVISRVSQGGAVMDAPTFHNLLKCTRGNGRVPLGLSGCFQTCLAACWWNSPVRYSKPQRRLQLNQHESRTRRKWLIFTI